MMMMWLRLLSAWNLFVPPHHERSQAPLSKALTRMSWTEKDSRSHPRRLRRALRSDAVPRRLQEGCRHAL